MPRSREVEQYPDQYLDFTEKAGLGTEITLVVPEVKRALSLRNQYYAFVGALKKKRYFLEAQPQKLTPDEQRMVDIAQLSYKVMCQVEATGDGSATIRWVNREASWQAQLLAKATIGGQALPTVTVEMPASLAALAVPAKDNQ